MAIGIILGFLFAAVCIVCILLAICFLSGTKLFAGKNNRMTAKRPLAGGLSAGVAAVAFILFLFIPFSFHTVNAGEVAVVKHLGEARNVRTAGTYFDFWVTETYETYDAKVQNIDIIANAYSSDAQTMDITMTVQYQIDSSKAIEIANNYGKLETLSNRIQSVTIEKTKSVLSKYQAMKIIETRESISPEVESTVKGAIDNNYYITVNTVVLTNIDFSDAFEKTVEDKMIAEQEQLKAEYEAEKARIEAEAAAKVATIEAEAKLKIAEAEAKAKIAAAEGDASAQKLIAQAEAYATQIKIVELARSMGHNVNEVKDDEGTVTAYTIEWGTGTEAETSKKVLLDYLQYLEYLAKWDGKLPQVVADGSNVMIPVTPTDPTA